MELSNHLSNIYLTASFSQRGELTELIHHASGWRIMNGDSRAMGFEALLPQPQKRNYLLSASHQHHATITKQNDSLSFNWPTLVGPDGATFLIELTLTVSLQEEQLTFSAEIRNDSNHTLETLTWPCLGNITIPAGSEQFQGRFMASCQLADLPIYPKFLNQKGGYGVDCPTQSAASWVSPFYLLESGHQGLYVGNHDYPPRQLLHYFTELRPGWEFSDSVNMGTFPSEDTLSGQPVQLVFKPTRFCYVRPDETISTPPVVLAPYQGTWHKGVDHYRTWRNTWFEAPPKPDWAQEPHAWHQLHINSPEDELRCQYRDLVRYGEAAAKHGVKAIQLVGWTTNGQDEGNPSHATDDRLGTREDLKEAIRQIQDMGVQVILFTKFTWADRGTEWFRSELEKLATKDPFGNAHYHMGYQYQTPTQLADINTTRFSPMCVCCQDWIDIAEKEFRGIVELGSSGMLFDEAFHHGIIAADVTHCFDPKHGHPVPAYIFAGDIDLEAMFHRVINDTRAGFFFSGEALNDRQFCNYHTSYFRTSSPQVIPAGRYIDSHTGQMMAVSGHNDRNNINMALAFKYIISHEPRMFKGDLEEYPDTLEYAKKMDKLRRRYQPWLWDSEFMHTLGLHVTPHSGPAPAFARHVAPNGHQAVVIYNTDLKDPCFFSLILDQPPAQLVRVDPENPEPQPMTNLEQLEIAPQCCIVLLEP